MPFDVPEPNVEDFLKFAFRQISVRLVKQELHDQALVVIEPRQAEAP
jgi:hypothetical protein